MSGREGEFGTSAGQAADELTRGREAYEGRDFASACEALTAADRAGTLDGEDLDRLAMSAAMAAPPGKPRSVFFSKACFTASSSPYCCAIAFFSCAHDSAKPS